MRVSGVKREGRRLSCFVEMGGETSELFFEFSEASPVKLSSSGNWIVAALLLSCMKLGETLVLQEPISPLLFRNLKTVQEIYKAWVPGHSAIEIVAPLQEQLAGPERVGLLFSRGADSFYSLLKHDHCISELIVLHGFEFPWNEDTRFREHLTSVRLVAEAFNKRVIVVRTNVKDHLLRYTHWDFSHGAALASVALCLEGSISKCIIASTCSYAQLHPWGSHPILDPLWSTESLQFLHDGTEALRVDKLRLIADNKLAMKYLRACDNPSSSGHCGECEKCLRTMVGLHVIGRLADCPAMPHRVDPRVIGRLHLDGGEAAFFREFLPFSIEPPALRRAICRALRNQRYGLRPTSGRVLSIRSRVRHIADWARLIRRVFAGEG
jgi:hypothetical protein